jgi:hypothetical protein
LTASTFSAESRSLDDDEDDDTPTAASRPNPNPPSPRLSRRVVRFKRDDAAVKGNVVVVADTAAATAPRPPPHWGLPFTLVVVLLPVVVGVSHPSSAAWSAVASSSYPHKPRPSQPSQPSQPSRARSPKPDVNRSIKLETRRDETGRDGARRPSDRFKLTTTDATDDDRRRPTTDDRRPTTRRHP